MSGSDYMPPYFPSRAETALYRDLLRQCAEVLREDVEGCLDCDWGDGSTGYTYDGAEPCGHCTPRRDLLKRVEAVI